MLVTTTPVLWGRTYQELNVVVAGSPPLIEGPTPAPIVNGYVRALALLQWHAAQLGAQAVIGVQISMNPQGYCLLTGTAIRFQRQYSQSIPPWSTEEPPQIRPPDREPPWQPSSPEAWDFLWDLTQDL